MTLFTISRLRVYTSRFKDQGRCSVRIIQYQASSWGFVVCSSWDIDRILKQSCSLLLRLEPLCQPGLSSRSRGPVDSWETAVSCKVWSERYCNFQGLEQLVAFSCSYASRTFRECLQGRWVWSQWARCLRVFGTCRCWSSNDSNQWVFHFCVVFWVLATSHTQPLIALEI